MTTNASLWPCFFHMAALWSLAVAQPILDLLGENPEFFVAHAARPVDLVAFVLLLCGVGPVLSGIGVWGADRLGVGAIALWAVVSVLLGLIALPIVNRTWPLEATSALVTAMAAGGALGAAYMWLTPLRLFASFLTPAIVVVPIVFLALPGIRALVWSAEAPRAFSPVELAETPPVVMIVFDQLPLPSILARDGSIDETLYPSFASLAADAVWFSGATAVADLTEMALPAVLTGTKPVVGRLPTAREHPGNLFTLLGPSHRVIAVEPITRLCPAAVCDRDHPSPIRWVESVLLDVGVVYLHLVSPQGLVDRLPSITQNWKDFVANDDARGRWAGQRDGDRRLSVQEFAAEIDRQSGERPPFYFLHVLLPHEPWVYLPSGQRYTIGGRMVGLDRQGRWSDDESAVLRAYQRHLLQVRFADALLGEVLDRLRMVGLYDDALIVVTSDHGASFQSEFLFRRPRAESFAEIGSVPLLVKQPGQQSGVVISANVETIDIVPTVAGVLGTTLPWEVDGVDALASAPAFRDEKVLVFSDGDGEATASSDIQSDVADVVARKFARFENPDGFDQPRLGYYDALVGRRIDIDIDIDIDVPAGDESGEFDDPALVVSPHGQIQVAVDLLNLFLDVDPAGGFVPARITGAVLDLADDAAVPTLAVSVNGVIAGIARPYTFSVAGRRHTWEVVVDPGRFVAGANDIGVFVVRADVAGGLALEPAFRSAPPDASSAINLILQPAEDVGGVMTSGFFGTEWSRQQPFRWTRDVATVTLTTVPEPRPVELWFEVLMTGPVPKTVTVAINGCSLFEGKISGAWSRALPLSGCELGSEEVEIRLQSTVAGPSPVDRRSLGVAVTRLELR